MHINCILLIKICKEKKVKKIFIWNLEEWILQLCSKSQLASLIPYKNFFNQIPINPHAFFKGTNLQRYLARQ